MPDRRYIKNRRRRARRQALDTLLRRQDYKCHYCGVELVRVRDLQEREILWQSSETISWREGGETHQAQIATVDHLTPLSQGGANTQDNLVASCAPCNQERRDTE